MIDKKFKHICNMVDSILGDYNRTGYCSIDGEDIHVELNDDFGQSTLPLDTVIIQELNDLFGVTGDLFVSNMSLGDDFRPCVWLSYEGVFK